MEQNGTSDIVSAATRGFPAEVKPLFVRSHDDHAVVLLETGTRSHSYPYVVLCRRRDGRWHEVASSDMSGWYQTADDQGVLVFWGSTEGLESPILVSFDGAQHETETAGGYFFVAWWDVLDPANYVEPSWPEVVTRP